MRWLPAGGIVGDYMQETVFELGLEVGQTWVNGASGKVFQTTWMAQRQGNTRNAWKKANKRLSLGCHGYKVYCV